VGRGLSNGLIPTRLGVRSPGTNVLADFVSLAQAVSRHVVVHSEDDDRRSPETGEEEQTMSAITFHQGLTIEVATAVRQELLRLAYAEDQLTPAEAARVAYWEPCPPSVQGHRAAAAALRADADRIAA